MSLGQDRDLGGGSSSGSIRPDVLEMGRGPRPRTLSPEKRAALVEEFESFRGAEALVDVPSFEVLKDSYGATLKGVAAVRVTAAELTPTMYLKFRIMARELSKKKTDLTSDRLAQGIISTYVKTGDFMPPIVAAGFSKLEAKKAESSAVAAIRLFLKQRRQSPVH